MGISTGGRFSVPSGTIISTYVEYAGEYAFLGYRRAEPVRVQAGGGRRRTRAAQFWGRGGSGALSVTVLGMRKTAARRRRSARASTTHRDVREPAPTDGMLSGPGRLRCRRSRARCSAWSSR